MTEKEKQFYEKLQELEMSLFKTQNFLSKHNFEIEKMCIYKQIEMVRKIHINYSLFMDGTFTIDQIDLER